MISKYEALSPMFYSALSPQHSALCFNHRQKEAGTEHDVGLQRLQTQAATGGKTPRQKKDPNEPQAAFDIMDRAMLKIQEIDTSAWTEEDNTAFRDSLANLKAEIDNYLNPSSNLA